MYNRINCIEIANKIKEEIINDIKDLPYKPSYTCYIISDENGIFNSASEKYVSLKEKTSNECGVECTIKRMSTAEFRDEMKELSFNTKITRAILQLPAPNICVEAFNEAISTGSVVDVDHLGDDVHADMWNNSFDRQPATPRGVVTVITDVLGSVSGKKIAIVGSRSKTTGRYLVPMLQRLNATVSLYHSKSIIHKGEFMDYDVVVSCVGSAGMIKQEHLGNGGKVLVDVGVDFVEGKVRGDFDEDTRILNLYTPWVNGIGLLTRTCLVRNVIESYIMK